MKNLMLLGEILWDLKYEIFVLLICIATIVCCGLFYIVSESTVATCLSWGYSEARTTLLFQRFCQIEVNETDYTVPFNEAWEWMQTTGKEKMK